MTFADLFAPFSDPPTVQPGRADYADKASPTFNVEGKVSILEIERKTCLPIGIESQLGLSALSATALVPLDQPFADGQCYADAGACEVATHLDLFRADLAGPWIRRHGVLIATRRPAGRPA